MHPKVQFDLDLSDRRVDLIQNDIDVAVRISLLLDSSLVARRLFNSHIIVAASPAYLERHGTPDTPDALRDHHCLTYSNLNDADHWPWYDQNGAQQRTKVKVGHGGEQR